MITALGVDPSLTATGLVWLGVESRGGEPEVLETKVIDLPGKGRAKAIQVAKEIHRYAEYCDADYIMLEGYGLNFRHTFSVIPLVELGSIARFLLHESGRSYYEARPTQLKKFVTGNGGATKKQILRSTRERWKFNTKNDNLADAYGLARMALVIGGVVKEPGMDIDFLLDISRQDPS